MTDRFITVVFRIKPEDQTTLVQLENHPKAVAFSMGDHLKDRYFCPRCGKRVHFFDQDSVHTCTPPADTRTDWSCA